MIMILFGLAGAGKTYIGNLISKHYDFYHQDGDEWLTDDMSNYIIEKKLFTLSMRENFTEIMISKAKLLQKMNKNIVISQAFYLSQNRDEFSRHFPRKEVMFLEVRSTKNIIKSRIIKRNNYVDYEYAASMEQYFEPIENGIILHNNKNGKSEILSQLTPIIRSFT